MTSWLLDRGQDEAITVRPLDDPIGHYEVLAGKTRLAAAVRLGWNALDARIREDLTEDTAAVAFIASSNAQRRTESPIRQALMIEAMFARGMTLHQAGAIYGIESESGVRNKLQLLKLPEPWRSRVVSGEMLESIARCVVPYADCKPLLKHFDKSYQEAQKHGWRRSWASRWASRKDAEQTIRRIVDDHTRPIDKREKHHYGWQQGDHPRYFELDEKLEQSLQVVQLPLGKNGKLVQRALNVKRYDQLQKPLIAKKLKEREARKGKKTKGSKAAGDEKKKRQAQTDQVKRKVEQWRHAFLRLLISQAIKPGDWRTIALVPWAMAMQQAGYQSIDLGNLVTQLNRSSYADGFETLTALLSQIDEAGDPITDAEEAQAKLLRWIFWPQDESAEEGSFVGPELPERLPPLEYSAVEQIAQLLEINVRDGWIRATQRTKEREMIERFFRFHFRWQLEDLAAEQKLSGEPLNGKAALVDSLLTSHHSNKPLKLPKSIEAAATKPPRSTRRKR